MESRAVRARAAELLGDADAHVEGMQMEAQLKELPERSAALRYRHALDEHADRMEPDHELEHRTPPRTAVACVVAAQLQTSRQLRRCVDEGAAVGEWCG